MYFRKINVIQNELFCIFVGFSLSRSFYRFCSENKFHDQHLFGFSLDVRCNTWLICEIHNVIRKLGWKFSQVILCSYSILLQLVIIYHYFSLPPPIVLQNLIYEFSCTNVMNVKIAKHLGIFQLCSFAECCFPYCFAKYTKYFEYSKSTCTYSKRY